MSLQNAQDGRREIQKRTFTKWMNVHLRRRDPPTEVHDLFRDIQDGKILMMLLEELTGCKMLYRFRSSSQRIFRLNNISKALAFLDDRHVTLLGIDASAVADGVASVVLHLIWNIILHFQVKEMTGGLRRRLSSSLSSLSMGSDLSDLTDGAKPNSGQQTAKSPKYNGKSIKSLLLWVQKCTVKFGVEVHDFSRSWKSGLVFLALIKSMNPDLVDLRKSLSQDPEENLKQAFTTAHTSLDIPPLLEPQDVACSYPDEKSIITYVSLFLMHCPDMVEDLSAAATSPHMSQFRSLETLEDREDAEPVFSPVETSHELLLWKRWGRRSSNSTDKRTSSSRQQPPSPLDAGVLNPDIQSWLDSSVDRGYSKTKANELCFSLSSEEGIYSLTPLDSDEEDAYSYIMDLNQDLQKIQANRRVPRVEEESEEISPISDKEPEGFFTNSDNCVLEVQSHDDLNGKGRDLSENIHQERTGKGENVVESKGVAVKESLRTQVEDKSPRNLKNTKSDHFIESHPQSILDFRKEYNIISTTIEKEGGTDAQELLGKTQNKDPHDFAVEAANVLTPEYEVKDLKEVNKTHESKGLRQNEIKTKKTVSIDVSKTIYLNLGDLFSQSSRNYREESEAKANLEARAMTSFSKEKRVLVQTVAPSSGLKRTELHILLFLWMLLYCCLIGHEIISC